MRYSQSLLPTLKENPAEAEVVSHRLMLRAGFMRKLTSGIYTYLPYGLAAIRKVEEIVREEMNRAGAQELLMPMVQPADLWQESGRYEKYGPELLRFKDRHERESCLGPTHEEVITDIIRRDVHSYRDLPLNLYQIQTKFRDEVRPRFGLMRGREFIMKDAYSFDMNDQMAEISYRKMHDAYNRIFKRCGLDFRAVEADSGAIGGSFSHEFMVLAETGEDTIVICEKCEYAANMEKARVAAPQLDNSIELSAMEKVETPGKRKVEAVCKFMDIVPEQLVKTMVYLADGEPVGVLLRGDHEVEEVKLKNLLKATDIVMAEDKEVFDATGVSSGYLGPVGGSIRLVADQQVEAMRNFVTGANEKNFHLKNVNMHRDFEVESIADLRQVTTEDLCPLCSGKLELTEGIEVGHIFKLGDSYSVALGAVFQDNEGQEKPFVMGCYGIGVSRVVAAAIEQNHDANGIIFPVPLAPYKAIILNLDLKDNEITAASEKIYQDLLDQGIETLLDDRDERPGAKFKDADLLGIPYRVTVGKSYAQKGVIEIRRRCDGVTEEIVVADVVPYIVKGVAEATL
ncbi:proline--tRNA ligase [Desulfopila inferna]|uniref:proline--tRNA ligase n=1 Tax=Desulfopila inferna TaxID=468528 RepID=UPI001962E7FB|nr:proline--tRNA ligase [Desulfopila inferna]MBM9605395.1 proline--tRNA ligase [Desulfopila inferna]